MKINEIFIGKYLGWRNYSNLHKIYQSSSVIALPLKRKKSTYATKQFPIIADMLKLIPVNYLTVVQIKAKIKG